MYFCARKFLKFARFKKGWVRGFQRGEGGVSPPSPLWHSSFINDLEVISAAPQAVTRKMGYF